ncbi:DnaB-like helicase C-terminal domain-containing protein [Vitreimonas flagellata]|uniref:DnaB-like helicase C-terminal domain-containing protein n=1 Tax=Vitreimonas flagellata TaxID=2560861 RepID=UPI001EF8B53C|nr:DnaB-like helicase C-terminal domain-containing protein [Vitreimonas flagellata]
MADLVHAVEAVQAWAGEENARDTEQARRSAVAEASRVNQEIGDTRARLRAADTSLETLALAARPPTPLEADARQHFVIQGGKHVELAQLLLEEKAPDAGAVLEEVDALSREHVAYDAVVSELGANASDIARERRRDLAEAVGDAASSASALYARVLGNAAPGGDVREASLGYVETGCSDFDVCFGGLPRGAVTLLAARPAMGSTSLALGWARAIAKQAPVLYVTLDLDAEQIATRALAAEVEIEPHRIRRGEISEDEYAGLRDAALASQGLPLQFEADPDMSLDQLWERAQAIASGAEGLDLIVVDPVDRLNEGNVSENLAALAQMARALDTPVLAIATLSPSVERRRDKRPVLRDLSGRILRHTGMALMLYREEYYHLRREPAPGTEKHYFWQKKLEEAANRAELVAVKHPEHKTGGIQLMFSSKGPKFLELGD